jgi:hypothetical protein
MQESDGATREERVRSDQNTTRRQVPGAPDHCACSLFDVSDVRGQPMQRRGHRSLLPCRFKPVPESNPLKPTCLYGCFLHAPPNFFDPL